MVGCMEWISNMVGWTISRCVDDDDDDDGDDDDDDDDDDDVQIYMDEL